MTMPRKLPTVSGGRGPRFVRHTGVVARVDIRDHEGELIAPDVAFESVGDASILIVPQLFETVAPETTLARLGALDVRAIVSPGFEARFHWQCISRGVLALPLASEVVAELARWAASCERPELTIDLDAQSIEPSGSDWPALPFEVEARVRRKLLLGLTDEEEMLQHVGSIAARRAEDRQRRPWLYGQSQRPRGSTPRPENEEAS